MTTEQTALVPSASDIAENKYDGRTKEGRLAKKNLEFLIEEGFEMDGDQSLNPKQWDSPEDISTTCWYDEETNTLHDFESSGLYQCQLCKEIHHYYDDINEALRNSSEWVCDSCWAKEE